MQIFLLNLKKSLGEKNKMGNLYFGVNAWFVDVRTSSAPRD